MIYLDKNKCEGSFSRTVCFFLLDRSISMAGNSINQLNTALTQIISEIATSNELYNRLELSIVQFNEKADCLVKPSFAEDINPVPVLTAKGQANIIDAVYEGLKIVKERKEYYRSMGLFHYKPWIILITNGKDNSGKNPDDLANILKQLDNHKSLIFMPVGLPTADFDFLNKIATDRYKPMELTDLRFTKFYYDYDIHCFHNNDSTKENDPNWGWEMIKK